MGEKHSLSSMYKVEPRYDEGPRDWQNLFAKMRLSYRGSFPCIKFTITGATNIVHCIKNFVIKRLVKPTFLCTEKHELLCDNIGPHTFPKCSTFLCEAIGTFFSFSCEREKPCFVYIQANKGVLLLSV